MAHGLIPWYSDGSNTKSYTYNVNVILHGNLLDTIIFTWYFTSNIIANVLNMVFYGTKTW